MRNCLDGNDTVALGFLSLIKLPCRFTISHRIVGRLDIRPRQIAVPIFGVASTFLLTSGQVLTADTAAIRNIVTGIGKTPDLARLK